MTIQVGINGFGRIGRTFVRRALERGDIEVVAVNDITDARTLAHLLAFDSTYGRLDAAVTSTDDAIIINGTPVAVLSSRDPAQIDWGKLGAAVVIESTRKFRARDLRRARSTAVSIVPSTTGAARTTGEVISELAGRSGGARSRGGRVADQPDRRARAGYDRG